MARPVTPNVLSGKARDRKAYAMYDEMRQQPVDVAPLSGVSASRDKLRRRYRADRRRLRKGGQKIKRCGLPAQHIDDNAGVEQHYFRR